ncbi:hypothetical protein [Agreia sp. COWG]|uniref:hypothetical protein n=1 Tax=Agreia sp. COWG TaxID=2773266 RepID=UPI0019278B50|nr:hypothetical protein [Agreia sp. COWG]CAD6001944.1 protein of unknown function [Agreia sp. COWG]
MGAVLAAIGAGAIGVAIVVVGMLSVLNRPGGASRRAEALQRTDPHLAEELRQVQAQIDRGKSRQVL